MLLMELIKTCAWTDAQTFVWHPCPLTGEISLSFDKAMFYLIHDPYLLPKLAIHNTLILCVIFNYMHAIPYKAKHTNIKPLSSHSLTHTKSDRLNVVV